MKKMFILALLVLSACAEQGKKELDQQEVEEWIESVIPRKIRTSFDNGYGALHTAEMEEITVKEMGLLQIEDENNRFIPVTIEYKEFYTIRGNTDQETKTRKCFFIFTKSTDEKWYLSEVTGDRKLPVLNWRKKIMKEHQKKPLF
jgi:hypothetical protein